MRAALPLPIYAPRTEAGYYRDVRIGLNLSQSDFGSLVDANPSTISSWENAHSRPNHFQRALMAAFQTAIDADAPIRPDLDAIIGSCGPVYALYLLLHAARGVT